MCPEFTEMLVQHSACFPYVHIFISSFSAFVNDYGCYQGIFLVSLQNGKNALRHSTCSLPVTPGMHRVNCKCTHQRRPRILKWKGCGAPWSPVIYTLLFTRLCHVYHHATFRVGS